MPTAGRSLAALLGFTFAIAGCASGRFVMPSATPTAFPDARAAFEEATRTCRQIQSYRAELRASGSFDGRRFPTLRLGLAADRAGRIALDARVAGSALFTLRGTSDEATLLLSRERQVAVGRTDEILDALIGLPIAADRLLAVLTGCVSTGHEASGGQAVGAFVRVHAPDAVLYLARRSGRWQVRAGVFGPILADYVQMGAEGPSQVVLRSVVGRTPVVDVSIRIVSVDLAPLEPSLFTVTVPTGSERVSLAGLRESGPLSRRAP